MWLNYLFFLPIFILSLFLWFELKQIRNAHFRTAMGVVVFIMIVLNIYFQWYNWGKFHFYCLHPGEILMFWLSYPENSLSIQFGILSFIFLLVPYKSFNKRIIIAIHFNFLIGLAFIIKLLAKELPAESAQEFTNALYQSQHVAFINSITIMLILVTFTVKDLFKVC